MRHKRSAMPEREGRKPATWRERLLELDEDVFEMSRLEPAKTVAVPGEKLHLASTPPEFTRLYAELERRIAAIGEATDIAGESPAAEQSYVLGICSAVGGEGKTTVALHLALTIARDTFKRVCLIDLSMGNDDLSRCLGVAANGPGAIAVMEEADGAIPTLQIAGCDNLVIIPAGRRPANPQKTARSPRLAQMVVSLRQSFDMVVVDMPAVSSDNAAPLARHMDGIVMVSRAGATPSDVVARAIDTIGRDHVVGLVLNRAQSALPKWLRSQLTMESGQ